MKANYFETWFKRNYPGDDKGFATIKKIGEVLDKSIAKYCQEKKKKKRRRRKKRRK